MAWQDSLSKVTHPDGRSLIGGSFRGVPFFVESSDRSGGRRIVTHEFAQNDLPAHDDMGRKARTFNVSCYVLGDDYVAQRDALLSALEDQSGAGELVHPYFGTKRVRAGSISTRESTADGGFASFQIEFLDAPLSAAPTIVKDYSTLVVSVADAAFISNQTEFEERYNVVGQANFAVESLRDELVSLTAKMDSGLSRVTETTQELALLSVNVDLITNTAETLVRTPADVIDTFLDTVLQLEESIEASPKEVLSALMDAYDIQPIEDSPGDSSTRVLERANQLALSDALRRALVIQASKMMVDVVFETTEDATELRDRAIAALDELALTAGDVAFQSIVDLRSALYQAVPGDSVLASVQTIQRNVDLPSILLSHQLYGTSKNEQDISDRNEAQHPAFMSGPIKVLSFV